MKRIVSVFARIPHSKLRKDDDTVDRLNHNFTTTICLIFAIIICSKQYIGEPISCWSPAHFTINHQHYTNSYCWTQDTYYLPFNERIPKEYQNNTNFPQSYCQWIPFILVSQAAMFHLPIVVWRTFIDHSGINTNNIVQVIQSDNRCEKTIAHTINQLNRYMRIWNRKSLRCLLYQKYLLCKLLFIINTLVQLFMLSYFLCGNIYHLYGVNIIREFVMQGQHRDLSPLFPPIILCDFEIRRLGNLHRYTVQCIIPINLFHEKIYIILWFWMVFATVINGASLMVWISRIFVRSLRRNYIKNLLHRLGKCDEEEKKLSAFVEDYLGRDGVFVLRLIEANTDETTIVELTYSLWDAYQTEQLHVTDDDA